MTTQKASRAVPVPGLMAEQGAWATMADQEARVATVPAPAPALAWHIWLEPYYTPQKQKNNTLGNLQGLTGDQETSTNSRGIRSPPWAKPVNKSPP